jgi:hypothetical protein
MPKQTIIELISALFILLFVYTALSKLFEIESFRLTLRIIPIVGTNNIYIFLAWFLPLLELIIALFLFIPRFRLTGLYGSLLLMVAFTVFIGYLLIVRDNDLPCSCGGVIQQMSWKQHLVFNTFFIILSIIGIILEKQKRRNIDISKEGETSKILYT